jgi:hypothetical protein
MTTDLIDRAKTTLAAPAPETTFAPILRTGVIIGSTVDGLGRVTFTHDALDQAIDAVKDQRRDYLDAAQQFLNAKGWSVDFQQPGLGAFRVNYRLGAVIDFDELVIAREGERHVIRFCVTVCVDMRGDLEQRKDAFRRRKGNIRYLKKNADVRLYSKMWVRTSCIEHQGAPAAALSYGQLAGFAAKFDTLAGELINALKAPYKRTIAELTDEPVRRVAVDTEYTISNFTASVEDEGFAVLYQHALIDNFHWADPEAKSLPTDARPAAQRLQQLRAAFFPQTAASDLKLITADNSLFAKSLYWMTVTPEKTTMAGLAADPFAKPPASDAEVLLAWKGAPSNALGVIATSRIASKM